MRILTALFISIIATSALAVGLKNGEYIYHWPKVNGLAINKACATENSLYSIAPVSLCAERQYIRKACTMGEAEVCRTLAKGERPAVGEIVKEDARCVSRVNKNVSVSRMVSEKQCAEYAYDEANAGTCKERISVRRKSPLTFKVPRYQYFYESGLEFAGHINYTIPSCD